MCFALTLVSGGAYLPSVSAPPAPATLWHIAQLTRNNSAPCDRSPLSSDVLDGMAGPGPSVATYAARAAICESVNCGGFSSICGPVAAAGMRPVPTWKSTAAAPTPTRVGATLVPVAASPWQLAQ